MLGSLQAELAEAHGLAIGASAIAAAAERHLQSATERHHLRGMRRDAEETRARCLAVEQTYGARVADELRAHAIVVEHTIADVIGTWMTAATGPIGAWRLVIMGAAGEVAAWRSVRALAAHAAPDERAVGKLAAWALPVHERHLQVALARASALAATADRRAPSWG